MASPISFSGLASGIDTDAVISALTASAKTPINKLTAQKTTFASQSKKLTDIKTKLQTLQTAAKALNTRSDALGNKAVSSDEKVFKATAAGGAAMGSFEVKVTSVASAQRSYSGGVGFTSDSEAGLISMSSLSIQVGAGSLVNVDITSDDTLASVAQKINSSGAAVTAGVIKENGVFRLQITGKETGAANAITFAGDGATALSLTGPPQKVAKDAAVEVDGFTVTSATNSITQAVPGVTINVVAEGTATVGLERDPDALKTKLNTFVTAYNDVMKTLNTEFSSTGGVAKAADSLGSDSTARSIQSTLRSVLSNVASNGDSTITTLGSMGVAVTRDGTLQFDEAKYTKATAADYEGVATALSGLTDGTGLMSRISSAIDPYAKTDGALKTKIDSLSASSRRIDSQVANMQRRLDKYEEGLRKQYTTLESTIAGLQSQGSALSGIISSM